VGRVERAKGSHVLADLWRQYRARRPHSPRLVLLGPVHEDLAGDSAVVVAGRQPEDVKWGALQACEFAVTPSAWESFSLVVLEAWLAGAPVVVNRRCAATLEHCLRSGGGLSFLDYADFETVADRLLSDAALRERLVANGRAYTHEVFNWPAIVDRYETLSDRILARVEPQIPVTPG
jgi:glycosyltransferase involved in cell wall biosynthesis